MIGGGGCEERQRGREEGRDRQTADSHTLSQRYHLALRMKDRKESPAHLEDRLGDIR